MKSVLRYQSFVGLASASALSSSSTQSLRSQPSPYTRIFLSQFRPFSRTQKFVKPEDTKSSKPSNPAKSQDAIGTAETKAGKKELNLEPNDETLLINDKAFQLRLKIVADDFKTRLSHLRTGRPDPSMLDHIKVNAYNNVMPLTSVAQVSFASAKLLQVNVFDAGMVQEVDRAIRTSNLNLNPQIENQMVNVPIPKTTKESREESAKEAKQLFEGAKKKVNLLRRDAIKTVKDKKGHPAVSEDAIFKKDKEIDEIISKHNKELEAMLEKKQKEILTA